MSDKGKKRGIPYWRKILVTGDTGFLGHHIVPELEKKYSMAHVIRPQGTMFFDLTNPRAVEVLFNSIVNNPYEPGALDVVVNLAALSGGIQDNTERQASYWYQNTMINANIIEQSALRKYGVSRLIQFMGGCSYPNEVGRSTPFKEEELWSGLPVESSLGYSAAKKMNVISAFAYEKQFGLRTTVLVPTNLIGPWDNFSEQQSHVAPALIRRFIEARDEGYETVTVWGSGKPIRDFIYAGDVARYLPYFIDNNAGIGPYNISTGKGTSIAELAEMIAHETKFKGKIHFDRTKPDGQMFKTLDNTKLLEFLNTNYPNVSIGAISKMITPLDEAIATTVEWYEKRVLGR
jgi:GDP-L-fucose synthase